MPHARSQFDFRYAVENTRVVRLPTRALETFGNTLVNYHLVAELMDHPGKVRIREGRLQAFKPLIIVPDANAMRAELEGFGEEAHKYLDWLKENGEHLRFFQYGYRLKQEAYSEQVVGDRVEAVLERVVADVKARNEPFDVVVRGVDDPWDVCLVRTFFEIAGHSAPKNLEEFEAAQQQESLDGIPGEIRREVEQAFARAEQDSSLIPALGKLLRERKVFDQYQDRFFALVRS